ncbi:hypothetical protein LIER_21731 [Lithospermum erythrorhizon]|uniref:Uncharacterized protein n=1 Tax=Lithospermum erythrorhizon TaxID=34254 RepID=A0AAV3QR83_LITER
MAGDEAGNGPPPPEDGPVITFEPGDEVSDLQNNLPHVPPSFSPFAQPAAGDIFLAYQAGGHGLTDIDVALPTSSQQQVLSNPISTQAPPSQSILPQPPSSLVDDSGPQPLIQPQPSDQGHGSAMDNHRPNNSLTSKTPNSSGLPTTGPPHLSSVQDPPYRPPYKSSTSPPVPALHAASITSVQPALLAMQKALLQPLQPVQLSMVQPLHQPVEPPLTSPCLISPITSPLISPPPIP